MKTPKPNKIYTRADFAKWGEIGGAKVKGAAKRQSADHYKRISKLGVAARLLNRTKAKA